MIENQEASISQRILSLEQTITVILTRLDSIQQTLKQTHSNISSNPLEKYIASESSQINSAMQRQVRQSNRQHNRRHSQPEGHTPPFIKRFDSEKIPDSKYFGMIKKSILLNSEEMEHLREKMIDLQKYCIQKIMGVQEGITILTRLSHLIQTRLTEQQEVLILAQVEKEKIVVQVKDPQYEINRMIRKYHKKQPINNTPLKKHFATDYH